MRTLLYEWVRNIVFYQILTSIIINIIPKDTYRKYIRFFLGLLFIVIATKPIFEMFHLAESMDVNYVHEMLEQELEEYEKMEER